MCSLGSPPCGGLGIEVRCVDGERSGQFSHERGDGAVSSGSQSGEAVAA